MFFWVIEFLNPQSFVFYSVFQYVWVKSWREVDIRRMLDFAHTFALVYVVFWSRECFE